MNNNLVLPLLALVLAIVAAFFPFWVGGPPSPNEPARFPAIRSGTVLSAVILILFLAATLIWPSTYPQGPWVTLGLALGVLAACLSANANPGRAGYAIGLGAAAAGAVHFVPAAGLASAQIALLVGAFIGAFATGGLRPPVAGGYLCAFAAVPIVAADFLGRAATGSDPSGSTGVALGVAFLLAAVVGGLLSKASNSAILRLGLPFVVLLLAGYLVCWQYLANGDLGAMWFGGVIVGLIVHLLFVGERQTEPFRFVLSSVIWLAMAAVAFGLQQGYGMAVALLAGTTTLALFGNMRGMATLSLAVAILIYRLFREIYPEESRALDIGQHYTMVGIALGALLPVLPLEWGRVRRGNIGAVTIWTAILCGIPVAAAVLLGSKGAIGMVIGLSFAALIEGLRGAGSLASAGIASGIGCLTVLSYGWLGDWADLERSAKIKAIIVVAIAAALLGALLLGVSRAPADEVEAV